MSGFTELSPKKFDYDLPSEKIAQYPLEERDQSRLLYYRAGEIDTRQFKDITGLLPENSLLIYNQTRVIQARLFFFKESGAKVEVFLLEPETPTREINKAFECKSPVSWNVLIGNSKKWKSGLLSTQFEIDGEPVTLYAERHEENKKIVYFSWVPAQYSFSEIIEHFGKTPLPPYMKRDAEESDKDRYQTIFALQEGSVAAPTAGLHFTPEVFKKLEKKGIKKAEVTLHVGVGTFKPVSSDNLLEHEMHTERIYIPRKTIESIIKQEGSPVVVTGTTSMRTIESLYWHGVKLLVDRKAPTQIHIHQWDPFNNRYDKDISKADALNAVLNRMDEEGLDTISGETQLMIIPGYDFKICDVLITNFHMPRSTLLMLVAAFIGDDWEKAYQYALENDFRFLSYGDSCLFFKKEITA